MTPGPADFSVAITFGATPFGFVAYRHDAYLISGSEGYWLPLPSWAFAIGILTLAWLEWRLGRLAWAWAVRAWRRRRQKT